MCILLPVSRDPSRVRCLWCAIDQRCYTCNSKGTNDECNQEEIVVCASNEVRDQFPRSHFNMLSCSQHVSEATRLQLILVVCCLIQIVSILTCTSRDPVKLFRESLFSFTSRNVFYVLAFCWVFPSECPSSPCIARWCTDVNFLLPHIM